MFASTERAELAALWDELVTGTTKVVSWSHAEGTWSMVVTRHCERHHAVQALRRRDVDIVENALLRGVRKHVAVEAGLSCSSVAVILQSCFHFMGFGCLPSRIPGLLVAAAHACHHPASKQHRAAAGSSVQRQVAQRTITVGRPDTLLAAWLAPAEHAVIHLLIEGMTYLEIAEARHTSVRTVANQVASGFRRLNVSGRAELLCLLARWGLERPQAPAKRPPSVLPSPGRRGSSRRASPREDVGSRPQSFSPSLAT